MLIIHWLVMTASIMIVAYVIPGVTVSGFFAALWVALFLGIVNVLLKPLLILITLPINILTLGLFTFIINGLLILLASSVIKGFQVSGFWVAVLFSILLSIVNFLLNFFLGAR
ncbi:phage holin family protein [Syntrophorhabdus aromaticivorans]|jgi:putative membrane protein|uniref:Phage holin family protein n=1 Tax=Syntrophorhabdus aromaticivorans TaxID=328301 RepID=A0A351U2L0_9BACT|nr:phage holin family protein [Syntrophorhabdus aromaticivorans]NLW34898.1 phage holin family protein [Syntrophorhabdus aromaticivorans]HBA54191.1 phage holin family protein [Syntrophorhabdus aromaticivorans]